MNEKVRKGSYSDLLETSSTRIASIPSKERRRFLNRSGYDETLGIPGNDALVSVPDQESTSKSMLTPQYPGQSFISSLQNTQRRRRIGSEPRKTHLRRVSPLMQEQSEKHKSNLSYRLNKTLIKVENFKAQEEKLTEMISKTLSKVEKIQDFRSELEKCIEREEARFHNVMTNAAVTIQKFWRGQYLRKNVYIPMKERYNLSQLARLKGIVDETYTCLLYTSPSPRDRQKSRMPSSA
eukprot:TRINITY_DN9420_c0_g1_i4.p1 TRINITY_DN9420_c0_g1~~TRINITY_DN9420_c0_g1_i4.p1  ORF type:complete len:237 (-),score=51.14 TRINITY_DN9420_c0_g1_i4:10-720(-)